MIDALFWYTGLIAWILIAFGWLSNFYIHVRDRVTMTRSEKGGPTAG